MSKYKGQIALFFIFVVIAMLLLGLFFIYVWNYFEVKRIEAKIELSVQASDKGKNLSVLFEAKDVKAFMEILGNRFAEGAPQEEIAYIEQIVDRLSYSLVLWSLEQYGEVGGFYEIFGKLVEEEIDPDVKLAWPAPVSTLSSPFGYRMLDGRRDIHGGIDFAIPIGTPVYAAAEGIILYIYDGCSDVNLNCITASEAERQAAGCNCNKGLGNYVVIEHTFGTKTYYTFYSHLSKIDVIPGQKVEAGDKIAQSGNSGYSTGPHLHFELADNIRSDFIKTDAYAKNPCTYLPEAPQNCVSQEGYVVAKFKAEIPIPGAQESGFKTIVGVT